MQGGNANLQGGTGIPLGNYSPQPAINVQSSPANNISLSAPKQSSAVDPTSDALDAQYQDILKQIQAQQTAYAPSLNLSSIYSQAGKAAEKSVNPYYTKQLKDFQAQQAQDKITQQQQTQTNIANLQTQLQNTVEGNAIAQQRTGQDVLQNEQQIAQQANQTQQDQGTQFDQARIAQAKQLASGGLTTSGLGAQQVLGSETNRNAQEASQAADVAQQNQNQELFKARTFEDLTRSGSLATQSEKTGETQANFDLNKYIQGQKTQLKSEKNDLESQRLSKVAQETQNKAKLAVNKFIQSISDPAQRHAAAQEYGGLF